MSVRRLSLAFCALAILLGALQAWNTRFDMNPDGVQYLDNADAYRTGDFSHALNSQWSPLYPWLIGAMFSAARPGAYQQFPVVHLVNFLIYLLALGAFLYFVRALQNALPSADPAKAEHRTLSFLLIAYASFLYSTLDLTNLGQVTPDLVVSVFAYLTAGLLLELATGPANATRSLVLGVVTALGYLAKTPFLFYALLSAGIVFALALQPVLTLQAGVSVPKRRVLPRAAVAAAALAAFAAIAVPYIWVLSHAHGRFTFGDSGKFNIIWVVNGVSYYHWQGGPPGNGKPVHPTRQLASDPAIFEFAGPIVATYPPWYDPIYWAEGAQIAYRSADFARALVRQIRYYGYLVNHRQLPLLYAMLVLFILFPAKRLIASNLKAVWPILLFASAPFVMYAPIHAEARYLAPFFVLLWSALALALVHHSGKLPPRVPLAIASVAAFLMLIESVAAVTQMPPIDSAQPAHASARLDYKIARDLEGLGLRRGDQVAIVSGNVPYSWARLAGARISMEVSFSEAGVEERAAEWRKAEPILAAGRVAFVVSPAIAGVVDQPGWRELDRAGVFAYPLPR